MRKLFFIIIFSLVIIIGVILWNNIYSKQLVELLYPLKFEDYIIEYSKKNDIPPEIVCGVILTESSFNPNAVSHKNAKGLMQIIEETNSWIALHLKEKSEFERILEPEFNIKRGTWLLSYLYKKFGTWDVALAAYNAGIGRVSGWLNNNEYSSDGKNLKYIPFDETRAYVEKVLDVTAVYKKLYFNN